MPRINISELPIVDDTPGALQRVVTRLYDMLRSIAIQLNSLSEGSIAGRYSAGVSVPAAGSYKQGDIRWNTAPIVSGSAGSRYVVLLWVCIASGTPGTWVECQTRTGT